MSENERDSELLEAWMNGSENAAATIFERYHARLTALVRAKLSRKLARRVDPEDVLLSAYRSFFVTTRDRRALSVANGDLWPLLTTFVLRKLARQVRHHTADRRSVDHEQVSSPDWAQGMLQRGPTAEHAAVLLEEVERLMSRLDATAREVLVLTLQGQDANMIAGRLGLNERSVRRALERIRDLIPLEHADQMAPSKSPVEALPREKVLDQSREAKQGTATYNQFVLQQFVGSGAFSKVYRAVERSTGLTVAVKFLRKECWHDTRATDALIREYNLLKQLNHEKILAIRDWGTTRRGALFLVTDFVTGMNLAEWCRRFRPSVERILGVVRAIADAVAAAHAKQILHGDLKPANVLMGDDGRVILCDFGLARHATDPDDVPRGGTAGFLAPEQVSDAFGPVTIQTDVYGLGGILFSLLVGRPPMIGRDLPETMANVLSASAPMPPSSFGVACSAGVDELVLRCLQKEAVHRYATIQELVQALDSI